MLNLSIELTGTSPLLMHNPRMIDPEFAIVREIKQLTAKRKKTDEDLYRIGMLEWFGGLYTMQSQNGRKKAREIVCQPVSKPYKSFIEAGKVSRDGTNVERALSLIGINVPLEYEGPTDIEQLWKDERFISRLPVRIGQMRVMRVRPEFFPWKMVVEGRLIENAGLNFDQFERIVELAGVAIGIGDNRRNGYGRYVAKIETRR